jgi:3',5'-cyclic-AMP phosphodiesterase
MLLYCDNSTGPGYEYVNTIEEPELVSVSDTEVIFTWRTDTRGDGWVILNDGVEEKMYDCHQPPTYYHYCYLSDLIPGISYSYQLKSGDKFAQTTDRSPGSFTTLLPPSGELLFQFATVNDMHVGEQTAGLICTGEDTCLNEGFQWPDPNNPYWLFMNNSMVQQINNHQNVDFLVVKGDLTSTATQEQFEQAKEILDQLTIPYYVVRGNHDRVGDSPEDYFLSIFEKDSSFYSFIHKNFVFIILDTSNLQTGEPTLSQEQCDWLETELATHTDKKAFIFTHHPVTEDSPMYSINETERIRLYDAIDGYNNVVAILCGHSHRAEITYAHPIGSIPCVETPSSKEYPGGYNIISVYENGWRQMFYRLNCANCLEWIEITKQEYWGNAPELLFGDLEDRSFVFTW